MCKVNLTLCKLKLQVDDNIYLYKLGVLYLVFYVLQDEQEADVEEAGQERKRTVKRKIDDDYIYVY